MSFIELFRVAFTSIRANIMRSLLTGLGIMIGVAAVITVVSIVQGGEKAMDDQLKAMGSSLMTVYTSSRRRGGISSGSGATARLTEADAIALASQIPEIVAVSPTIRGNAHMVMGNQNWGADAMGITEDYLSVLNWSIDEGREITQEEFNSGSRVILIGKTVTRELFGEASAVGQRIRINNVPVTIVGTLDSKGFSGGWRDMDNVVMMPLKSARSRLLGRRGTSGDTVDNIYVTVAEDWMMPDVENQIQETLRSRHRIAANVEEPFSIFNMSEMMQARQESERLWQFVLAAVAPIALIVGGIGIMNIMLVTVSERTREIGLRMALGAKQSDIRKQFLVEATALATLGGVAGIMVSIFAVWFIANSGNFDVLYEWSVVVLAVVLSAAVGIFFGFFPAQKAAEKDPIEALRTE